MAALSWEQQQAKEAADFKRALDENWQEALGALGAPLEGGSSFGRAPYGWKTPTPDALGEAVGKGVLNQFAAFERERDPQGHVYGAQKTTEERVAYLSLERRAFSMCSWGVNLAAGAGAYPQALAAAGEAFGSVALPVNPGKLRVSLIQAAIKSSASSDLDYAAGNLVALAANKGIWDMDSVWQGSYDVKNPSGLTGRDYKDHLGNIFSEMIRVSCLRPRCAEAVAQIMERVVSYDMHESWDGVQNWERWGEKTGESLRHDYVQAKNIPQELRDRLPKEFWLGVKNAMTPGSKMSADLLPRLMSAAEEDEPFKRKVCASVWSFLDRKEIDAFEARFPNYAQAHAAEAVSALCSGALGIIGLYRLEAALKRASGKWAWSGFKSAGYKSPDGVADADMGPRGAGVKIALEAVVALRQAGVIAEELKEAKRLRAQEALEKGEKAPVQKRSPAQSKAL